MMRRLVFKINGVDYSTSINRYGYSCNYTPRNGPNGGMVKSGAYKVDILAWKAVLTLACNAIKSDVQAQIITACTTDYVQATFFDTRINAERTAKFSTSLSPQSIALLTPEGVNWFTGLVLTLEEQ